MKLLTLSLAGLVIAAYVFNCHETSATAPGANPVLNFRDLQHQAARASTDTFRCIPTGRSVGGSPELLIVDRKFTKLVDKNVPVSALKSFGFDFNDAIAIQRSINRWARAVHHHKGLAVWSGERRLDKSKGVVVGVILIDPRLVEYVDMEASKLKIPMHHLWRDSVLFAVSHASFTNHRAYLSAVPNGERSRGRVGMYLIKRSSHVGLATMDELAIAAE